jgi:hypothetical protein
VVEVWGGDDISQPTKADTDVGMDEDRLERQQDDVTAEAGPAEAKGIERQDGTGSNEYLVDRVKMVRGQPVHLVNTVMDLVKPPEQRRPVGGPMTEIPAQLGDGEPRKDLEPHRQGGNEVTHVRWHEQVEQATSGDHDDEQADAEEHGVDDEVDDVGSPAASKHALGVESEQSLHRDEDRGQDDEPDREPPLDHQGAQQHDKGQDGGKDAAHRRPVGRRGDLRWRGTHRIDLLLRGHLFAQKDSKPVATYLAVGR